ncbi:uncharacterized protein LOC132059096 [Lycium ferocissimum]|uniref:uncharacterized protein LOC132059096 n=1 Tax=Lycium ferocissimum TaxID=112874 RepID=UPI0028156EC8|nr:uncharacterized protein LOC132059096 [Lycium ferocissimum]
MFNDDEPLAFKKMHEFSTVDGFVEITESLADMIKFIANEPSVGLFYIQQHTQKAAPNLVNLKNNIEERSRELSLHTEDLEDSITVIGSMKECGIPIANEMIKDLRHSLAVISKKQPKKGLISGPRSSFPVGITTSWSPATWGRSTGSEEDDDRAPGYLSNVFRSAKQKASNFTWAPLESGESRLAKSEPSSSDKDEPSVSRTNDTLLAADASSSSSLGRANSEDLRVSGQTIDDEVQQEQVYKSMSHDQLMSLSENFEEFRADKEAKLEEWLGE